MPKSLTPHIGAFAARVKNMNQSGHKEISLSSSEARNLQAELFQLLELITQLQSEVIANKTTQIEFVGGEF